MNLLIRNIKQLVTVNANNDTKKVGTQMKDLGIIEDAAILILNGKFEWIGRESDFNLDIPKGIHIIDGSSTVALPGFVDAHTHLVFGGSRDQEFALRAEGKTYQQIAEQGGGIFHTVQATRAASKRELKKSASKYLDAMLQHGTTTVEIKSGYGLDFETEVKMMEVIHELEREHYSTIISTFLGAHAFPPEYKTDHDVYIDFLCTELLPYISKRNLAHYCDVFCEDGYFNIEESRKILLRGRELGMALKLHADELSPSGGSMLAAELKAVSADHLEHISDEGIDGLRKSEVVAVLLPGVSFFLNHKYAPARKLIDSGVVVALASDFNPGSCMSYSMPLMMTIACTHMRMTVEEAIYATTLNAAAALGLSDRVGSVEIGKQADLILYDIPNYRYLAYHFGTNHVSKIIKNGTYLEF